MYEKGSSVTQWGEESSRWQLTSRLPRHGHPRCSFLCRPRSSFLSRAPL